MVGPCARNRDPCIHGQSGTLVARLTHKGATRPGRCCVIAWRGDGGMMVEIPHVLDAAGLARVRGLIDAAEWTDGNATSGHQSALAKRNMQLPEDSAAARQAGEVILNALAARSEEHTSELQSLMRISYAVFCLKKKII